MASHRQMELAKRRQSSVIIAPPESKQRPSHDHGRASHDRATRTRRSEVGQSVRHNDAWAAAGESRLSHGSNESQEAKKQHIALQYWTQFCTWLVQNNMFQALTMTLTFWALFGDDIRVSATSIDSDPSFNSMVIFCICIFTFEVIVASFGQYKYFLNFFFWLDVISTGSLLLDHTEIAESLFGGGNGEGDGSVARAGRASRAGTRAGRIVRVVRLVRIVKLYKSWAELRARRSRAKLLARVSPGDMDDFDVGDAGADDQGGEVRQSRVGKKLSDRSTKRVIVLVLSMLFIIPQFNVTTHESELSDSVDYAVEQIIESFQRWADATNWDPTTETVATAADNTTRSAAVAEFVSTDERRLYREEYERALLLMLSYHNAAITQCASEDVACPAEYANNIAWVGMTRFLDSSQPSLGYSITSLDVSAAVSEVFNRGTNSFVSGSLAGSVQTQLESWSMSCSLFDTAYIGMSTVAGLGCPMTDLRYSERRIVTLPTVRADALQQSSKFAFLTVVVDRRGEVALEAYLNVVQTFFLCFVLGGGALIFSKDANDLVLKPIESMKVKMDRIRENPLVAMRLGDEEYRKEVRKQLIEASSKAKKSLRIEYIQSIPVIGERLAKYMERKSEKNKLKPEPMETVVLEKTIIKIGGLLALGFGEAGAEVVGHNMNSDSGVNAMVPGKKMDAIFGFCDIRNFTDATEILQDKVMIFVNQIGEIVHAIVDDWSGAPNKNIGDAFLLVWRLTAANELLGRKLSDMSIIAMAKMLAQINKSPVLAEYREHPGLLQRMANYRVKLGLGLHTGWAIEGAIGSEHKIDASYLSPNVQICQMLEGATKYYSSHMLISSDLIDNCSKTMRLACREIDHVMMQGTLDVRLYTFDLNLSVLPVEERKHKAKVNRFKIRQLRQAAKARRLQKEFVVTSKLHSDKDLMRMRHAYQRDDFDFLDEWDMAYKWYNVGYWQRAKPALERCKDLLPWEDGPSKVLLGYMAECNWEPPENFRGRRAFAG